MLIDASSWRKNRRRRIGLVVNLISGSNLTLGTIGLIVGFIVGNIQLVVVAGALILLGFAGFFSEAVTKRNIVRETEDALRRLRTELPPMAGPIGSLPRIIDEVLETGSFETRNGIFFVGDGTDPTYYEIRVTTRQAEARRAPDTAPITTIRRATDTPNSVAEDEATVNGLFSESAALTPEEEAYRAGYRLGELSTRYTVSDTYPKEHRAGFDDAQRGRPPLVGQKGSTTSWTVAKHRRSALDRAMKEASGDLLNNQ